jgi:hypothetical protein
MADTFLAKESEKIGRRSKKSLIVHPAGMHGVENTERQACFSRKSPTGKGIFRL